MMLGGASYAASRCNVSGQQLFGPANNRAVCNHPALTLKTIKLVARPQRRLRSIPTPKSRVFAALSDSSSTVVADVLSTLQLAPSWNDDAEINMVMKFGGSSVATAERMAEVAQIATAFPGTFPVVVLSAMGKTTNLLLEAGEEALKTPHAAISSLAPLRAIKELHRDTADRLRVDSTCRAEIESLLTELAQLLVGISIMQDLTPRAKDSLVSFGERLSTRLFAAFLRAHNVSAKQYDAYEIGVITNDNFTNADVDYEATLPGLRDSLRRRPGAPAELPVVTGFLGKGRTTGAITTLGRGGSDLTCTLIGAALNLPEVQVWKDVDGVLTSDPRVVDGATPVPLLTFEEATELAFFGATVLHPLAMQPAAERGDMGVRVKNSYNRSAAGTLITSERDMTHALVTSVVLKQNVTLIDVVSNRMLGQYGFLASVFEVFAKKRLSIDVVATSEVSISLTLDPAKTAWEQEAIDAELDGLMGTFAGVARASYRRHMSIISLICNVQRTSEILERVFRVLGREGVRVQMMSQGASKTNISLVVDDKESKHALRALHHEFFGGAR
jgi:aspartate kinase